MAFFFSSTKYSSNVSSANWLASGHDGTDAMLIGGTGKLIISASNGIHHISGSVDLGLSPDNKAYHIRTLAGPLILSSSGGGSFVYASGNMTVEQALLVKGDSVLSGNVVVGGQLYDLNSNLILSSSVGSVIAASGSLDLPNSDKAYHIRAVNSFLIFSSSAGSVVSLSGVLNIEDTTKNYSIKATNGHLILSSSAGSTVAFSSALDIIEPVNTIKNYSIRSTTGDLILSSTSTSNISISGGLRMISQTNRNFHIAGSNDLIFSSTVGNITFSGACDIENNGKPYDFRNKNSHLILTSSVGSIIAASSSLDFPNADKNYHIRAVNSHLILSSSVGSRVTVSSTFAVTDNFIVTGTGQMQSLQVTGVGAFGIRSSLSDLILSSTFSSITAISSSLQCVNADKSFHARAVNSHFILSSSAGSLVAFSGGIIMKGHLSSTLPSSPPTGSIFYVEDLGFLAVYVNSTSNYMRLSSGSF